MPPRFITLESSALCRTPGEDRDGEGFFSETNYPHDVSRVTHIGRVSKVTEGGQTVVTGGKMFPPEFTHVGLHQLINRTLLIKFRQIS